jgi:hypothetical protein
MLGSFGVRAERSRVAEIFAFLFEIEALGQS